MILHQGLRGRFGACLGVRTSIGLAAKHEISPVAGVGEIRGQHVFDQQMDADHPFTLVPLESRTDCRWFRCEKDGKISERMIDWLIVAYFILPFQDLSFWYILVILIMMKNQFILLKKVIMKKFMRQRYHLQTVKSSGELANQSINRLLPYLLENSPREAFVV